MSEDPNIRIGNQGRKFKNIRYLETDTVDGDSCFWVPETARKLTDGYFDKNGYYVPKKYGFDTLQVHVSKTVTDNDGVDWTIGIDPIDIPDINPETINTIIDDLDIDIDDIDIDDLDDILDEFGIDIDIDDLRDVIIDLGIDPDDIDIDDIIQIIDYIQDIDDIDIEDIDIDDINDIMDALGIDPDNIGPGDVQDILDGLGIDVPIDDLQNIMDGLGIDPGNISPEDILGLLPYVDGDEYDPSDPFDPDNPPDPEVPVYPGNPDDPGFDPDSFDPETFDPDSFDPDDFFPDQFYPDIYDPDPFDPDKYYPDGYDPEEYDPEIYDPDPDGIGPDPIPDYDGFDDEDPIDDGVPRVPDIGIPDAEIECPFDPETGLPDPTHDGEPIAPDAWDKFPGTLPEGEWDFSFDPPTDMQDPDFDPTDIPWELSFPGTDGLPEGWTFDPKTGEWSLTELPDEIRIMHVPTKTKYMDGEEIDLDGLVVQAYRGGAVWNAMPEKYWNGQIPVHELMYDPQVAEYDESLIPHYEGLNVVTIEGSNEYRRLFGEPCHYNKDFVIGYGWANYWGEEPGKCYFGSYYKFDSAVQLTQYDNKIFGVAYPKAVGSVKACCPEKGIYGYYGSAGTKWSVIRGYGPGKDHDPFENVPESDHDPTKAIVDGMTVNVTVSWARPKDNKVLEATFVISVDIEVDPDGGAGGHWGGTTPSGEYGGSHYSGKF